VNKKVLGRTLECDDGLTTVASFAGLEASDFNVTTDEHVSSPGGAAASALRDFRKRRPQDSRRLLLVRRGRVGLGSGDARIHAEALVSRTSSLARAVSKIAGGPARSLEGLSPSPPMSGQIPPEPWRGAPASALN
jgi:hypothetical protein